MKKTYENHSTCSQGKRDITKKWISKTKFSSGKSLILMGAASGFDRHMDDEHKKGFPSNNVIIAEQDLPTYSALVHYQYNHPQYKHVTIVHDDLINVFYAHPLGTITHVDFDTATGYQDSINSMGLLINAHVDNLFWTVALRGTSMEKVWPRSKGGWRKNVRQRDGSYKDMPPLQKDIIPKLLNEFAGAELYNIECEQYTGVGSGNNATGGSQMLMFILNKK